MSLKNWIAVLGGALGAFMAILDIQVTNASIREISGALSLDIGESGWISSAYLIAEIIIIPLTAFLSEVIGTKRYLQINGLAFVASSVLCGLSWNATSLIIFRAFQGVTGGTLIPLSFQLILKLMPEAQRGIGITLFGLTVTLAPTLGPSLGGWLTDEYGWRSIFFINLIPGIFMFLSISYGLAATAIRWMELKKVDIISVITLTLGLSTFTYLLEEGPKEDWFDSTVIRYNFLVAALTLPYFVFRQFEIENPILNLKLLKNRNFALGTIVTTIAGCALFSGMYSMSLFLGQVKQYSPNQIGGILMWVGLPQLLVMPLLPVLMKKVDLRLLSIFGIALFAYSNWTNSQFSELNGGEDFIYSLLLRALGQPLFVVPLSFMAMASIPKESSGDASAIFNVMRNIGASLGIALTSTFLINQQSAHFTEMSGSLSGYDFGVMKKFVELDVLFREDGFTFQESLQKTLQTLSQPLIQKSIVYSFNDIYTLLAFLLIGCVLVIAIMNRTIAPDAKHKTGLGH